MASDERLTRLICEALRADDRLSTQSIEVEVRSRVVTLRGAVQSHKRKLAAQEVAASFADCRDVVNELAVEPPGIMTDDEVATHVRAALDACADVTEQVVTVAVHNGRVALHGHVASRWERTAAEDVALGARGVRAVQNLIVVDLDREIEDESLCRAIQESLTHARALRGVEVRVSVAGELAVLSGEVPDPWLKESAEDIVQRFRVGTIRNEIVVTS